MSELYLVLHKVRGQPAFDIAERCDDLGTADDPGPWWIIPTSGHRAYPYRKWDMEDIYDGSNIDPPKPLYVYETVDLPDDLEDHYSALVSPITKISTLANDLLTALGLEGKPFKRRRVE